MEPTTEARWWWRGRVPDDVAGWFAGLDGVVHEEARTDHYLTLPDDPDVGIKARAGERLEVKALHARERSVRVGDDVTATLEQWVKWSFPLAPSAPGEDDLGSMWLRTTKVRWLVRVEACELELAGVDVAGDPWWSLAAEAEGIGGDGRARLAAGLRWLLATGRPEGLTLTAAASFGYAELLDRHRSSE